MSDDTYEYEQLDPGIREVVRFLRVNGFAVTDSGDGTGPLRSGNEGAIVFIATTAEKLVAETDRLWQLLVDATADKVKSCPSVEVEAHYDPQTELAEIFLTGLDDAFFASLRG